MTVPICFSLATGRHHSSECRPVFVRCALPHRAGKIFSSHSRIIPSVQVLWTAFHRSSSQISESKLQNHVCIQIAEAEITGRSAANRSQSTGTGEKTT